jgi:uncharacterized membrane protein
MTLAIDLEREKLSRDLLGENYHELDEAERDVIDEMAREDTTAENFSETLDEQAGYWDRLADRVATIGGSWRFIFSFGAFMVVWTGLNVALLRPFKMDFDPYPFIFLNLMLSMLAAIQAPVIMMSQNRQDTKDRLRGELDFDVNRRAESEIQGLSRKLNMLGDKLGDVEDLIRESLSRGGVGGGVGPTEPARS